MSVISTVTVAQMREVDRITWRSGTGSGSKASPNPTLLAYTLNLNSTTSPSRIT